MRRLDSFNKNYRIKNKIRHFTQHKLSLSQVVDLILIIKFTEISD